MCTQSTDYRPDHGIQTGTGELLWGCGLGRCNPDIQSGFQHFEPLRASQACPLAHAVLGKRSAGTTQSSYTEADFVGQSFLIYPHTIPCVLEGFCCRSAACMCPSILLQLGLCFEGSLIEHKVLFLGNT